MTKRKRGMGKGERGRGKGEGKKVWCLGWCGMGETVCWS